MLFEVHIKFTPFNRPNFVKTMTLLREVRDFSTHVHLVLMAIITPANSTAVREIHVVDY